MRDILLASSHEALHIFPDQIGFDVDFITNLPSAQISVLHGKWNDRHRKSPLSANIDRQANAVDGDRPFRYEQGAEKRGNRKSNDGELAFLFNRLNRAETVDMAGH